MPSFQREDTNFSKYIQEYCQLPKYKNEKYLPVMVSRRVDDEFFAVMAMPYGLANDYVSRLYYYETPQNKWALVYRETVNPKKSENQITSDLYFKRNLCAIHNGKNVFSRDFATNATYRPLLKKLNDEKSADTLDLSRMIMGCLKIEQSICRKWKIKEIRDFINIKFSHKER